VLERADTVQLAERDRLSARAPTQDPLVAARPSRSRVRRKECERAVAGSAKLRAGSSTGCHAPRGRYTCTRRRRGRYIARGSCFGRQEEEGQHYGRGAAWCGRGAALMQREPWTHGKKATTTGEAVPAGVGEGTESANRVRRGVPSRATRRTVPGEPASTVPTAGRTYPLEAAPRAVRRVAGGRGRRRKATHQGDEGGAWSGVCAVEWAHTSRRARCASSAAVQTKRASEREEVEGGRRDERRGRTALALPQPASSL